MRRGRTPELSVSSQTSQKRRRGGVTSSLVRTQPGNESVVWSCRGPAALVSKRRAPSHSSKANRSEIRLSAASGASGLAAGGERFHRVGVAKAPFRRDLPSHDAREVRTGEHGGL